MFIFPINPIVCKSKVGLMLIVCSMTMPVKKVYLILFTIYVDISIKKDISINKSNRDNTDVN